jgi:ribosomal protein S18 acetylase RimI-like enzyme
LNKSKLCEEYFFYLLNIRERTIMIRCKAEYKLRLAEQKDDKNILKVYKSIIGTQGCTWDEEYPSMEGIIEDIKMKSLYCLTDDKGEIIAVATAGPLNELDDIIWDSRMTKPCELARIGVLPCLQKKGIASQLLDAVIGDCKSIGYNGMRFLVSKTNYNALMLYNKFGFQNVGEVFRYGHDFYCYYKLLY